MKLTSRLILILLAIHFSACQTGLKNNPEILSDEHFQHIDFLASDSLMGRQPGTPFDRVAAKYIKDFFEINGFTLLGQSGYQFFEFIDHQDASEGNSFSVNKEQQALESDFIVLPFSSTDSVAGAVVFVGYGIDFKNDTISWNDYADVNLTGKWALILRGDPMPLDVGSPFINVIADRSKAMLAKEHGAAGVIFVSGTAFDENDKLSISRQKSFSVDIPVVHITRNAANLILSDTGQTIEQLESKILSLLKPTEPFIVGTQVCARTKVITRKKKTQNVVALIEGSHPKLKHQYVVLGAHFDHLGMGGEHSMSRDKDVLAVHNGADDNASGVSAVLEIGNKLRRKKLKRSVLVIAFAAEEMGLLGSRFFVENPLIPLDSVVAMINIDMVGRMDSAGKLEVGGVKTWNEADSILQLVNEEYNFNLKLSSQGYGPSDHASFYAKDIPVLFFSTGAHPEYHTPNDKVEHINFEGLTEVSRYIYDVIGEIGNEQEKPLFQSTGPAMPASRHGGDLKVRLGIMPDVSGAHDNGLEVLAANEGQPAAEAGIRKGDIITSINGNKISNIQDYMYHLSKLEVNTIISLKFIRDGREVVVLVKL